MQNNGFICAVLALFIVCTSAVFSSCGKADDTETITTVADTDELTKMSDTETDISTTKPSESAPPDTTIPAETETTEAEPPVTVPPDTTEIPPSIVSSLTKQSLKTTDGSALAYWLYTPANATENMPLLIYLHGGNGKGDDLEILTQYGFPQMLRDGQLGEIPAYIVIPQVSTDMKGWTDIKNSVRDLVYYCCNTYGTDGGRVSLTGHSMGGTGTWNLALAFPELFSCIAPMSGSITVSDANIDALSDIPVWAFVGSADKIVKPESSEQFIDALKKTNEDAHITIFDGAQHQDVPGLAYLDKEIDIINWLITDSE